LKYRLEVLYLTEFIIVEVQESKAGQLCQRELLGKAYKSIVGKVKLDETVAL